MGVPGYLGTTPGPGGSGRDAHGVHVPVLLQPVLAFLQAQPGRTTVDGTVGGGGHAEAILQSSAPHGRLLGLDRDPAALVAAGQRLARFGERVTLRHGSFAHLDTLAGDFAPVSGILLDLGLSSLQLADPDRGFSFRDEGPLDMRFDPSVGGVTAADLVNGLSVKELTSLLYAYGEERQAVRIATAIVAARPLHTTTQLANVVTQVVGRGRGRIHPATRTFQALRIVTNDEIGALEVGLLKALDLVGPGGRLVVISFHSLEDRVVKHFLRREARDCVCAPDSPVCTCGHRARLRIVTRRPVRPDSHEVSANPRARSARLRAAERIGD